MPNLELIPQWTLKLTTKELVLITKGLRGVRSDEDSSHMDALAEHILKLRIAAAKSTLGQYEKHERNLCADTGLNCD